MELQPEEVAVFYVFFSPQKNPQPCAGDLAITTQGQVPERLRLFHFNKLLRLPQEQLLLPSKRFGFDAR